MCALILSRPRNWAALAPRALFYFLNKIDLVRFVCDVLCAAHFCGLYLYNFKSDLFVICARPRPLSC